MDLSGLELYLLHRAVSAATSPAAKQFVLSELKTLESHASNKYLQAAVKALEVVVEADLAPGT